MEDVQQGIFVSLAPLMEFARFLAIMFYKVMKGLEIISLPAVCAGRVFFLRVHLKGGRLEQESTGAFNGHLRMRSVASTDSQVGARGWRGSSHRFSTEVKS